ncbi:hypothetical protein [Streptomyces sp. NBC_00989]|uniref:hypothetical protein n=1 Tax=Streptomyces sp. NBC_00989 TaxID=2903705 RepID=UPI003865598B|nr:hypothetical protein OG714_00315 [Streptomyces sp. NBC_00989]WSW98108.1 hypothetical protein OG714_53825 [Streptomyces sp. NBC_00989]
MIIESHHAEVPAGLPAAAAGGCRIPETDGVEAVFAAPDGTRLPRRRLAAAPVGRFEDLQAVAPLPAVPGRR